MISTSEAPLGHTDRMDVAPSATDTSLYDVVLADHLAAARGAVLVAETAAKEFRTALAVGAAQALEQQAERRAQQLVAERTATLTARVQALERLLRHHADTLASSPVPEVPVEVPVPPPTDAPVLVKAVGPKAPAKPAQPAVPKLPAVPELSAVPEPRTTPNTSSWPARPAAGRARDSGPAAAEVPSVPSMKDIFAGTRAASWLDGLLGTKR